MERYIGNFPSWQCSQSEVSYHKQKQSEWVQLNETFYKIKRYTEWIKSKLSKKLSHNFYKAGPPNAKTTGNRKVNKKRHRESVGRNMLRKVFQVIKWISQYSFCDGFLIGFCFLSQNLFIRKISFVENLQNYWKWDIGILRNFLGKTLTGIVHSSFYQDTVMLLFK